MNILVTGGRGFIGRHLCLKLESEGNKVFSLDKKTIKEVRATNDIKEIELDISFETEVLNKLFRENHIDMIYHLSAFTSICESQKDIKLDLDNTLMTTITILRMAQKYEVKKFVFTSSSTVYGLCGDSFKEDTPDLFPISYYGASKLACEAYISSFSSLFDIQCWVLRCGNIIGRDCDHGIMYDIRKKINKGVKEITLLGDGSQEKPFLFIDDFIRGLDCIVNKAKNKYNLFLIGNNTTTLLKRLASILEEKYPDFVVKWTNGETWPGDVTKYKYDISRVMHLGWTPVYSSDEAVRLSI